MMLQEWVLVLVGWACIQILDTRVNLLLNTPTLILGSSTLLLELFHLPSLGIPTTLVHRELPIHQHNPTHIQQPNQLPTHQLRVGSILPFKQPTHQQTEVCPTQCSLVTLLQPTQYSSRLTIL